jgi:hypothetical protein
VADLLAGTITAVGDERALFYGMRRQVSLGGDSVLVLGAPQSPWLLIQGARTAGLIPVDNPSFVASHGYFEGADTLGHILTVAYVPWICTGAPWSDSSTLIRVHRGSGVADTIARLLPKGDRIEASCDQPGQRPTEIRITFQQLGVGEESLIFPDGWIAIARLEPYRVDWRAPSGNWTFGPPLPHVQTPFDSVERQAWLDRQVLETGRRLEFSSSAMSVGFVPPFQPDPMVALPNGHLLIARTATAALREHRYDVVDRQGVLVSQIVLALDERIVGAGHSGLFVAWRRGDGRQELRVYPLG